MIIQEQGESANVRFSDHTSKRAKVLFSIEALAYISCTIAMLFVAGWALQEGAFVPVAFSLVFAAAFYLAFRRYLRRVTHREELLISPDSITVVKQINGKNTTVKYSINDIHRLRFIGFVQSVDHPLKTESFDYLGFQTQQSVIDAVTTEGNMAFDYEQQTIYFGIGVPSWDAAKLNELLKQKTGGQLFIADLPEEIPEEVWNHAQ